MFSFEKLEVWKRTREFLKKIYEVTSHFPKQEQFGLTNHIRKSAISVLSNISEATSRFGDADFKRFIEIALGSLYETTSQLFVALDSKYIVKKYFDNLYQESEIIARMLSKLSRSRDSRDD